MKKTSTKLLALLLALAMAFGLTACGENPKKDEAIDAFNKTSTAFNEVANIVNENTDSMKEDDIKTFQEMSELLTTYKNLLEGDGEISDEKYDEMITWFGTVQNWISQVKTELNGAFNSSIEAEK